MLLFQLMSMGTVLSGKSVALGLENLDWSLSLSLLDQQI